MIYGITIFLAGFIIDVLWVLYIKKINSNKPLMASLYSMLIGLCSITWVKIIVDDVIYGSLYLLGLFLGTYFTMNITKRKKKKKKFTETRRYKFERFLDRYNHTLELARTIFSAIAATFLILKFYGLI